MDFQFFCYVKHPETQCCAVSYCQSRSIEDLNEIFTHFFFFLQYISLKGSF